MRNNALRSLCICMILMLCFSMVACDVQLGGLLGKLLEKLPEISDGQMDQIEDLMTQEDILQGIPVPEETYEQIQTEQVQTEPLQTEPPQTYPDTVDPDESRPLDTEEYSEVPVASETFEETSYPEHFNPAENAINIGSAAELIAWTETIRFDGKEYYDVIINFTADIDLTGYVWIPIDGTYLDTVTFEGNGHTISNMTIQGNDTIPPDETHGFVYGIGFIRNAEYDLVFQNLTFDNVNITAWERHVGVIIGNVYSNATVTFSNVHVTNTVINGWKEYDNQDVSTGGHALAFRIGGFIGGVFAGEYSFVDCAVVNAQISGFHNMAGFVGFDATGNLMSDCFQNCMVSNVEMTFSYCMADSYSADQPRKFVSVFFNASDWVDNVDEFEQFGNTYDGITYIDYTTKMTYNPDNFRSWTYEEAHP